MGYVTLLRMSARLAAIASAVACAAATLIVAPPASAAPCPDVQVVFARGTSEPPGIGRVGQAFVDALRPQLGGRTIDGLRRQLPGRPTTSSGGRRRHRRHQLHQLAGRAMPRARASCSADTPRVRRSSTCWPASRRSGNKIGEVGSAPPLPANLDGNIAAVAVFGNPSAKFSIPITNSHLRRPRHRSVQGRRSDLLGRPQPVRAQRLRVVAGMPAQAANFVAGLV